MLSNPCRQVPPIPGDGDPTGTCPCVSLFQQRVYPEASASISPSALWLHVGSSGLTPRALRAVLLCVRSLLCPEVQHHVCLAVPFVVKGHKRGSHSRAGGSMESLTAAVSLTLTPDELRKVDTGSLRILLTATARGINPKQESNGFLNQLPCQRGHLGDRWLPLFPRLEPVGRSRVGRSCPYGQ